MIIEFCRMLTLSDYLWLIADLILIGLYGSWLIEKHIKKSIYIEPKRQNDSYIATLNYHVNNKGEE